MNCKKKKKKKNAFRIAIFRPATGNRLVFFSGLMTISTGACLHMLGLFFFMVESDSILTLLDESKSDPPAWSFKPCQAVTIRLPDCLGQSLFGSGNKDLHYTCLRYHRFTIIFKLFSNLIPLQKNLPLNLNRPEGFIEPHSSMYVQCSMWYSLQNWSLYPHTLMYVRLGHNDPWAESHMWPQ